MTATRNVRRVLVGIVTSDKMQKSITVEVKRTFKHPKYGKFMRKTRRYLADDPEQTAGVGDKVEITSTRPLSKRKRWRLVRVVERTKLGAEAPNLSLDGGAEGGGEA